MFIFLVIALIVNFVWNLQNKRLRDNEAATQMAMVLAGLDDNEPHCSSNVKPNKARLRIVNEEDLKITAIIGSGAFGVVFKVATKRNTLYIIL